MKQVKTNRPQKMSYQARLREYEQEKQRLWNACLSSEEYETEIKKVIRRLKI